MKKRDAAVLLSLTALMGLSVPSMAASGMYASATDLELSAERFTSASAGRDILLNGVVVDGKLSAGRNVMCRDCTISGNVSAGHDVQLERCTEVQSVASGHNTELLASRVLSHVSSGHNIMLDDVTVDRDLQAGNQVEAKNSTINGVLSLGGNSLRLDHSNAGEVRFIETANGNYNGSTINASTNGSTIISRGNFGGSVIVGGRGGGSNISVGPGSLSSVNGYTIKGAPDQTTVITPDQSIYVNGRRVSGSGPKTYGEYKSSHPGAPSVHGPGWSEGMDSPADSVKSKKTEGGPVVNVLELVNNSVVEGPIVFESGYGKVRVEKGSRFTGKVVNGTIERL